MEFNSFGCHDTHCCPKHGCKYGDDDCPVMKGLASGTRCKSCDSDDYYPTREEIHSIISMLGGDPSEIDTVEKRKDFFTKIAKRLP